MQKKLIVHEDWSGGNTFNKKMGKINQVFRSFGLDAIIRPGFLMVKQAWEAITISLSPMSTVTDMLYAVTDGNMYFAISFYIATLTTATTFTAVHTDATSEAIQALAEYQGKLFYSKDTHIGMYDFTTYTDSWKGITSGSPHPMRVSSDSFLYFGNGIYLNRWDGTTYSTNVFDLPMGWQVVTLDNFGVTYLAIGANFVGSSGSTQSKIYLWDRISASWNDEVDIPEQTIYASIFHKGALWTFAGTTNVSIYYTPLGSRTATRVFTFENLLQNLYSPSVYPNAVTVKNGRIWFGYSSNTAASDQVIPAIYSFNPDQKNMQMQGELLLSAISETGSDSSEITCVRSVPSATNPSVFMSWQYASTIVHGRQVESLSDPFASSIGVTASKTLTYEAPPGFKMHFDGFGIDTIIRSSGTITLEYMKDGDTNWTQIYQYSATNGTGTYGKYSIEGYNIMFRLTISSNLGTIPWAIRRFFGTGILVADPR